MADFRKAVKAGERDTLGMLVEFFDWSGSLEQQPTTGIVPLYEKLQNKLALTPHAHSEAPNTNSEAARVAS